MFPGADGRVPSVAGADESWFDTWLARPGRSAATCGPTRSARCAGSGADTRLVVDLVLHLADGGHRARVALGRRGRRRRPGGRDGAAARGAVRRHRVRARATPRRVLLAGDETAVPADLRASCATSGGRAGRGVPGGARRPATCWRCPRRPASPSRGSPATARRSASGSRRRCRAPRRTRPPAEVAEDEVDPDLWETPTYSSSGRGVSRRPRRRPGLGDLYAWIAGESSVVTGLRRQSGARPRDAPTPRRLHGVLATRRRDAVLGRS